MFNEVIKYIKSQFKSDFIPLHTPIFIGNEKKYLNECIDSTFVSSVGKFVDRFEVMIQEITGAKYAVATVNGTAALHIALHSIGVSKEDEVLTQPLSFVATCNAISYTGASPVFIDVDMDTMGMSAESLSTFLSTQCELINKQCRNKKTGKTIKACLPMHTFGFPCNIIEIVAICKKWNITVIEDAAESLGSYVGKQHTGTFGKIGIASFNGNKIATAGGGGCVITNDEVLAKKIKHLTTTAKEPHQWEYKHLEIGFNYRMPNINAALICAQLECLPQFLENKRTLSENYQAFFEKTSIKFKSETPNTTANYWLNTIVLKDQVERDAFLTLSNSQNVMTRPVWELMNRLPMFEHCETTALTNSKYLADRLVNIPSSVRL
jgi:aminotransferase in exopolysaccharide biosynthesis